MTEVNNRDFTGLEDVAQLINGDGFDDNKIEKEEFDKMISLIDSERERDILKTELDTRNKLDTLREEVIEHFVREIKENQTTNVQSLFVQMYQENPDNTTLKEIADRADFETEQSLYQRVSDEYERDVYVTISFEEWQENEGRGKYTSYMLELMEIELDTVYKKRGLRESGSTNEQEALKPLSSIIDDMLWHASTITLNHNRSNPYNQVVEPSGIDILMNSELYTIDKIAFEAIKKAPSYIPQDLTYREFQSYKYIKKIDDDGEKKYKNNEDKRKAKLYKATVPLIATIKSKILMDAIQSIIRERQLGSEGSNQLLTKYIAELQVLKEDIGSGVDGFFSDTRYELMLEYLQDAQGPGEFDYQGQMQKTTTTLLEKGFNAFTGKDNFTTRENLLHKKEEVLLDSGLFDKVPINFLHYKMPEVKRQEDGLPIGLPTMKGKWHQKPNTIEELGKERTGENENARTYWRHVSHDGTIHVELLVYCRQLDTEGKPKIVDGHEVWDSVGGIDYMSDGAYLRRTSVGELNYNETNGDTQTYRNIYYPNKIKLLGVIGLTDVVDEGTCGLVTSVDVPEEYYQDEGYSPERPTENPDTNPGGLNILKSLKVETPEDIDNLEEFNQTASEVVFDIVSEFKKGRKIISRRDSIDGKGDKEIKEFASDKDLADYIDGLHKTIRDGVLSRSPQVNGQDIFRPENMDGYMELIGKACTSLSLNERNLEIDLGDMKDQQLLALRKIEAGSYFHTYSALVLEKNEENPAKIQESLPGGGMRSVTIDIHQMLNDDFNEIMNSFDGGLAVDASSKEVEEWVLSKMSESHNGTRYPEISPEVFEERNREKREAHKYLYEKKEKELPKQNRKLLCSRMSSLLMKDLCLGIGPEVEILREQGDLRFFREAAEGLSEYNHMQTFEQRKVVRDIVKEVGKEVLIMAVSGGLLGAVAKGATRGYRAYKLSSMITIAEQGVFVSRWSKIAKFVGTTLYQGVGFTVLPNTFHHILGDITDEQLKDQLTNKWSYIHSTIMMGTLGAIKLGGGAIQATRQRGVITKAENTLASNGGRYIQNATVPRLIGTATFGTEYLALLGFQSFSMTEEAEEQMLKEFNEKYKHITDPQAKDILRIKFFLEPLAIMMFLGVQNIKLRGGERMESLETIKYDKTDPRKSTYKYTIGGSGNKRTYKRDGKTKKGQRGNQTEPKCQ